ncbi:O-acetylhomoserine aminocarboxypropyltransferase/cysteine synthase [Hungatella hathewayi DSM 13479]|uniref:O-acetylhomoserine aminocarboxypropyltransferase/cysteine synthase n=2 Tax=Hungatella hathewayi TaxID=154046 RepID=D3AS11_9FIRM|nr:O-acetylhomoserine aminocarboxypropyltransferase/cysteine synthase [Hungatella hathewayi DSM 13479]
MLKPEQQPIEPTNINPKEITNMSKYKNEYKFETLQLHVGQEQADPATGSRAVPIYQTTSYVFHDSAHAAARFGLADAGNIYGRLTNSTQDVLEKRLAALEGGAAALATASGAAAITYTIQALAQAGDHIVAQKTIYGGSYNLLAHTLPQFGVTTTFVDAHNLEELTAAIRPNTKAVYLETLGNPNSDIPDIDTIAEIAHAHGLPLVIDNTFGTPYLIRPIEHGADIVVHSATKFIGGHGTTLGGIIVDSGKFDWKASGKYDPIAKPNPSYHGVSFVDAAGPAAFVTYIRAILLRDTGATLSPFNAFLLLQGVETLSLRLERHAENTKKVVEYLSNHSQVEKVNHPSLPDHPDHALYEKYFPDGGASIFTFEIKGGQEEAWRFIDNLKIFSLLANVADVKSLVIHPASTTHSQLSREELLDQGIKPNTIRLSIGTEHIDDILADLENGFASL